MCKGARTVTALKVEGEGIGGATNQSITEEAKHTASMKGELREKSTGQVCGSAAKCLVVGLELLLSRAASSREELDVECRRVKTSWNLRHLHVCCCCN